MVINLFDITGFDGREQRLLSRTVGGDNRPFIQRVTSNAQKDLSRTLQGFTDPDAIREEKLADNRDKLQAFMNPDIFTVQAQLSAGGQGGNKERLLSMTPTRRLEEFTSFVNSQVPEAVRAKYNFLFSPPLDEQDLFDYEQQSQEGRIRILLTALSSLNGTRISPGQNPTADMLALDISAEKNNAADSPGSVFRLYEQWLDSKPGISETDATTPEILLKSGSGIPDRLRGDLTNLIDPAVQQSMLKEMYELYRNRRTDDNLTFAQAKVDQLQLTGSVEKKRLEQQSRGLVENFRNADPRLQLAMGVVGAYAVWKILKAKNPIGRWALAGGVGYFAYDRFINGNENAFNDMGKGVQKFAQTGGNLLKNLARELGVPIPRNQQDKLELMSQFITENRLNIPGHEAMTGMSALSGVKLGTIAAAFTPSMDGEQLGGNLIIDDGQTQLASAGRGLQSRQVDVSGNLLHKSLMLQMGGMGLSGREKTATINYLQSNNASVSKALTHAMYMLAMDETPNVKRAQEIENALIDYGSYDNLPANLKRQYMEIAFQGKLLAEGRYKDRSLVDVIADLQVKRKNKVEKKDDPAVEIPDVKTPARADEFALMENTSNFPITTTVPNDVLRDNGLADKDASEFLRNCEASGLLTADAALEIARRFDKIRRETPKLTEALQTIEKLKYAILVQSTKQETPLSKDDIILLVGPDDLDATAILNRVTGLISRFAISLPGRGFGSVASLGDVRSLITEPWFGSGPVQSQGEGFKRLTDRMNVYDKKVADMKDTGAVSKQMADALPARMAGAFGGKEKLQEYLRTNLIPGSNYMTRVNHAEQHMSQRMANALSRTMRLTHERDGFGRFDELGVTPIEQKNLASEFDLLFVDVMGDPLKGVSSMWQRTEDIDVFRRFDLSGVQAADFKNESQREELLGYARDMAILYVVQRSSGQDGLDTRPEFARRTRVMYDKVVAIIEEKKNAEFEAIKKEIADAKAANPNHIVDFEEIKGRLERLDIVLANTLGVQAHELRVILEKIYEEGFTDDEITLETLKAYSKNFIATLPPNANPPVTPSPANAPVGGANPPVGPSPANPPVSPSPANAPVTPSPANAPIGPSAANPPLSPSPANAPIGPSPANAPILPNTINTPAGLQALQDAIDALGLRGFFDVQVNPSGRGIDYALLPFNNSPEAKDIATSSVADVELLGSDAQTIVQILHQKMQEWHTNLSDTRRQEFVGSGNVIQMDGLRYTPDVTAPPSAPGPVPESIDPISNPPESPGRVPANL